jgi:hypothetical protein
VFSMQVRISPKNAAAIRRLILETKKRIPGLAVRVSAAAMINAATEEYVERARIASGPQGGK